MPNFEKNLIYKLCCDGEIYIGHTTNLYKRIHTHKNSIKNRHIYTSKLYNFIGDKPWYIEVIEMFPCKTSKEAIEREQHWIQILKPSLNTNRAFRTIEVQKKCDCIKSSKYYFKNKDKIREYQKIYQRKYQLRKRLEKKLEKIYSNTIYENNRGRE